MGAMTRMQSFLMSWLNSPVWSYAQWVKQFATKMMTVVPGLTVGPTVSGLPSGDTDGEIYLSNDLTPPQAWIWQGSGWNLMSGLTFVGIPPTSSSPGKVGQMATDGASYLYVCVAANTWARIALDFSF